ncbi:acetolactate synthase [Pseudoxanthomonas gei]|uniref:Acetolactate synthase n=1 Tax=Pseudoxanthomonas gei TaxID=1383030 RepID=A0ABX0A8S0_9GAMM|nr:ACT domain-containing protein [Pseudoxanthomonas gei]NDK37922.1 acetolactate synthase [Pseudoxanthomonas gei]
MRYRLDLVLKPAEGALTRVIGMAERRGFTPHSINGRNADGNGGWRVELVVDGQRPAETLRLQMLKVYDCVSVEITPVEIAPVEITPVEVVPMESAMAEEVS